MSFDVSNIPAENLPRIIVRPPVLDFKRQDLQVFSEGELVAVQIGNSTLRLHYEDALKVSQWIRMRAKEAKRRCGDVSRHWSALATLEDANAKKPRIF